jgi:hypothetical protein
MSSPWTIKLKVFFSLPFHFFIHVWFNWIKTQLVSSNGSTFEYNLHFFDHGRRLLNQQMFDYIYVVISLKYGYYWNGPHVLCVFKFWNVGIVRLGPRFSLCFSLKCEYCIWLGPRSNVCINLECKYCKVGSYVQYVF